MSDKNLINDLQKIADGQRAYASIREGGPKAQKELGVLRDLLESMGQAGELRYTDPAVVALDPPDCTVRTLGGQLAAAEVTELVSQDAIELKTIVYGKIISLSGCLLMSKKGGVL